MQQIDEGMFTTMFPICLHWEEQKLAYHLFRTGVACRMLSQVPGDLGLALHKCIAEYRVVLAECNIGREEKQLLWHPCTASQSSFFGTEAIEANATTNWLYICCDLQHQSSNESIWIGLKCLKIHSCAKFCLTLHFPWSQLQLSVCLWGGGGNQWTR